MPLRLARRRLFTIVLLTAATAVIGLVAAVWFVSRYYSTEQRFARSLPAFNAYAAQVSALPPASPLPPLPKPLGAFEASGVERLPHGFLFFCDYGNPFDANGFAYSTQQLPHTVDDKNLYTPIGGGWYDLWRN